MGGGVPLILDSMGFVVAHNLRNDVHHVKRLLRPYHEFCKHVILRRSAHLQDYKSSPFENVTTHLKILNVNIPTLGLSTIQEM